MIVIRLVAFLAVLAAASGGSWVFYQDSKPGGVLLFIASMVVFVAPAYFRLMGVISDPKTTNGADDAETQEGR